MADSREITLFTQKALLKQNERHLRNFGLASLSRRTGRSDALGKMLRNSPQMSHYNIEAPSVFQADIPAAVLATSLGCLPV